MKISSFLISVINVSKREFHRIFERKTLYSFLIFLPPILFSFFIYIYDKNSIRDISIAVCDEDNSELSNLFINYLNASPSLKVNFRASNEIEIEKLFKDGKIQGGIYIKKDFEKNIKKGKYSSVIVYRNSRNLIISNLLYKELNSIYRTISTGILIKKIAAREKKYDIAFAISNPIIVQNQYVFNPYYNYQIFLMPGLLPAMAHMIILVISSLLISSERFHNTFKDLKQAAASSSLAIFCGKFISHFFVNIPMALFLTSIIFAWLKLDFSFAFYYYLVGMLLLNAVSISAGIFLSSLFDNQMLSLEAAIFISTPVFIYSGYTFPTQAMPAFHQAISYFLPFCHFMNFQYKLFFIPSNNFYYGLEELSLLIFFFISFSLSSILLLRIKLEE